MVLFGRGAIIFSCLVFSQATQTLCCSLEMVSLEEQLYLNVDAPVLCQGQV